jgi:hypothetical protein
MRSDDHSGAEVPGSKSLPDSRRVRLRLSLVTGNLPARSSVRFYEADRRRGAIETLPEGADLRTATRRPHFQKHLRRRNAMRV